MPYEHRDLRALDKSLQSPTCVLVLSLGLAKSFAKRAAYWFDIYHNTETNLWFVCRQWSFTKTNNTMEGHRVSPALRTAQKAYEVFCEFLQDKMSGWQIVNLAFDGNTRQIPLDEMTLINQVRDLTRDPVGVMGVVGRKPSVQLSVQGVTVPKPRAAHLKELQTKRKAKAQW